MSHCSSSSASSCAAASASCSPASSCASTLGGAAAAAAAAAAANSYNHRSVGKSPDSNNGDWLLPAVVLTTLFVLMLGSAGSYRGTSSDSPAIKPGQGTLVR